MCLDRLADAFTTLYVTVSKCEHMMAVEVKQNLLIGALTELITFGRTSLENVQKDVAEGTKQLRFNVTLYLI